MRWGRSHCFFSADGSDILGNSFFLSLFFGSVSVAPDKCTGLILGHNIFAVAELRGH